MYDIHVDMQAIQIRNYKLGDGNLLLCAPLTAKEPNGLLQEAKEIQKSKVQMAEWRIDLFDMDPSYERIVELIGQLREILQEKILLATIRTKQEGGAFEGSQEKYVQIYNWVLQTRQADLIDIEYEIGDAWRDTLIENAHAHDCKVILSFHDFENTPTVSKMCEKLTGMMKTKGDIAKLAVMPTTKKDVAALLEASAIISSDAEKPLITMSMGSKGMISRFAGGLFGSSVSFVNVCGSSAPGQLKAEEILQFLALLQKTQAADLM